MYVGKHGIIYYRLIKKYLYPHIFLKIMTLDYISDRITKEEFLERTIPKVDQKVYWKLQKHT